MQKSPVAIILAAGLGTRMKSARTKMLHEVAGRPLIAWAVETARAAGCARVVTVLGHQSEQVKAALDARFGDGAVEIAIQAEQKGTGHAVMCALPALEAEPDDRVCVILSGDAPLFRAERVTALVEACDASESGVALVSTRTPESTAYGRLVRDANGKLLRIVEFKDATPQQRAIDEVNAGFYAMRLGLVRREVTSLSADNAQGELYLTDLAEAAAARGGAAVIDAPYEEIRGVNDRVDLAAVTASARRRINEGLMREGVTMIDPEAVYIDADAGPFGRDVWIGPGVHVRGKVSVGDGARLDAGCVVENVSIAGGVTVKPYCVLTHSQVGDSAELGPFTHLRPDSRVDEGAKVGNFVEMKKSHLMAGAKANHLAYLGDASIGAGANVGAGTITCNYDGVKKHRTTIEAGAFIGSDSQLVAPVTIGKGAYVGSGTTVTKDVPRGALALSRVKQVNVEGWADRFREAQEKRKK